MSGNEGADEHGFANRQDSQGEKPSRIASGDAPEWAHRALRRLSQLQYHNGKMFHFYDRRIALLERDYPRIAALFIAWGTPRPGCADVCHSEGFDPLPEAYPTAEARDAALGPFTSLVEFAAGTPLEVVEANFSASDVAIGPGLGEPGFEEIYSLLAPEWRARLRKEGWVRAVIGRNQYEVQADGRSISVGGLYGNFSDEGAVMVAEFLFADLLAAA